MAENRRQQQEIHRQAWHIYRLVRAKQDVQANLDLRALGEDMVPVAHALVLGKFRATPIVRFEWYIIGTVLVGAPLLFTLLLYEIFGGPPYWHNPAEVLIFYFGVFTAVFLSESLIALVVMEARDRRLRQQGAEHPIHRTNEIAGCALAGSRGNSAELIGALLEAGVVEPEPSLSTRRKLDEAIIKLLPYCLQETLLQLNISQRRALWSRLGRVVGTVRPSAAGPLGGRDPNLADEHHEVMVGVAILKAYELLPDENAVGTVRSLANMSPLGRGVGWLTLIEAAQHCLPILEEIVRRSRSGSELLRGSGSAYTGEEQLLRAPAMYGDKAEELLRSAE